MKFEAPQMILTALTIFGMGVAAAKFGQRKTDSYDFTDVLVGPAISVGLLWWGGFYG